MKPTRAQIRFLNECSTPIPETSEQASKLITAMLNNPTIPAQTTAPAIGPLTQEDGPQYIHAPNNQFIAVLKDGPEQVAYGRLFCAAPELLEALKVFVAMTESDIEWHVTTAIRNNEKMTEVIASRADWLTQARAAITQATL